MNEQDAQTEPNEPPDTPPAGTGLVVPEPEPTPDAGTPAAEPSEAGPPWHTRLRSGLAAQMAAKGIGSVGLAGFALAPAAVGALGLATDHPGLGALLGGVAVLLAWIATAPDAAGRPPAFAGLVAHALVPLWLGGVVVASASSGSSARAALAAWTSFMLMLLPLARLQAGERTLNRGAVLWSWSERAMALVLGVFLGRAGLAMFVVATITTADLVLRLVLLHPASDGSSRLPPSLSGLFGPDGKPQAGVRLALQLSLVVFAVLLVALGTADDWRF